MQLRLDPSALAAAYQAADPFPHAVLDGLFDEAELKGVLNAFPGVDSDYWRRFDTGEERKLGYEYTMPLPFEMHAFLYLMSSPTVLLFMEELTGIRGLIPDPYFGGGGPHQIERGGYLKVHTDFNVHPKFGLDRRVNALVYLNEDWDESYGGHLELWNEDLSACVQRVLPVFNRTVVFNTDERSWHGHPEPLTCPEGRTRRSVSFYYYTMGRPESERADPHATIFKVTPPAGE
jgi:2-oxoglutarate-Fe(II)-dependent oxygenase superfamily protein